MAKKSWMENIKIVDVLEKAFQKAVEEDSKKNKDYHPYRTTFLDSSGKMSPLCSECDRPESHPIHHKED